jgi:hypothetical protein
VYNIDSSLNKEKWVKDISKPQTPQRSAAQAASTTEKRSHEKE